MHVARIGGGERCAHGSSGETCRKETIGETQTYMENNINLDLREMGRVETGCSWLMMGTDGGHLLIR